MSESKHPIASLSGDVTIAVAAHGNAEATQACLQAIFASATGDYELILVDDCSADENATLNVFLEAQRTHCNTIIFQSQDLNLEYSGSVDAVLSHSSGKYIFFVSNDIIVTPYYLSVLLEAVASNPRVGVARGSSNFVDNGLESHNLKPINTIENMENVFDEGRDVYSLFGNLAAVDEYLTGDAFIVSRELIDAIGTYDPFFYGYFADHDYGLRAQLAGFETLLLPGAYAYHMAQANLNYLENEQREAKLRRRWLRVIENWARFKIKYNLPVEMEYTTLKAVPWEKLRQEPFNKARHYSTAKDYSAFRL